MKERIEEINKRKEMNFQVLTLVAAYLNECPTLVTKETIQEITNGNKDSEERAFCSFLANVFSEEDAFVKRLEKEYLFKGVKCLSPDTYTENPFFKNIPPYLFFNFFQLSKALLRDIVPRNKYRLHPKSK